MLQDLDRTTSARGGHRFHKKVTRICCQDFRLAPARPPACAASVPPCPGGFSGGRCRQSGSPRSACGNGRLHRNLSWKRACLNLPVSCIILIHLIPSIQHDSPGHCQSSCKASDPFCCSGNSLQLLYVHVLPSPLSKVLAARTGINWREVLSKRTALPKISGDIEASTLR